MGENLCQPPLLLPLSRAGVEPVALPGRGADPQFELPCGSERGTGLLTGPDDRGTLLLLLLRGPATLFDPSSPKRRNPLFEPEIAPLFELTWFEPIFDPPFPGRETSRLFPVDLPIDDAVALRAEKKCWFSETLRVVDAAAGRPLAE